MHAHACTCIHLHARSPLDLLGGWASSSDGLAHAGMPTQPYASTQPRAFQPLATRRLPPAACLLISRAFNPLTPLLRESSCDRNPNPNPSPTPKPKPNSNANPCPPPNPHPANFTLTPTLDPDPNLDPDLCYRRTPFSYLAPRSPTIR